MGRYRYLVLAWLFACRGPAGLLPLEVAADVTEGEGGAPAASSTPVREPGIGSSAPAESAVGGAATSADAPKAAGCAAQAVSLAEIHAGKVRPGIAVSVTRLVASSQKFLVSEAKSGSCLWGAFAAEMGKSGAGSGLFLVSFGAPHAEGEACVAGTDALPDDLAPGRAVEATGVLDEYAPAACDGVAAAQQLRVDVACPLRQGELGAAPEPAPIEPALATRLAAGNDPALLREWGGALVRLEGVSALQDTDDGDAVFPFGVMRLAEAPLEVHSRLYYFDLSEGGPRASVKAPRYGFPTNFQSVSGVVFLDYCSWVLAPRDRCSDLSPASAGCSAQARRP